MSGGVLVRMVFVQVVFVRGGFCPYTQCATPHWLVKSLLMKCPNTPLDFSRSTGG